MPQIRKYKYKFRTEILCGALWGKISTVCCIPSLGSYKKKKTFVHILDISVGKSNFLVFGSILLLIKYTAKYEDVCFDIRGLV